MDLVAEAIEAIVIQMEEVNGGAFPQHVSPLKREVMTGRARSRSTPLACLLMTV